MEPVEQDHSSRPGLGKDGGQTAPTQSIVSDTSEAMVDMTLRLSYGHVEVQIARDGGVTLTTYGPRGGFNAEFETPFPKQLIELLEHVVTASAEASWIEGIHAQPLPNSDRWLVARPGWRGNHSVQLHTSREGAPRWYRDTVGAPLVEVPLADLPAVVALLRDRLPSPPELRLA